MRDVYKKSQTRRRQIRINGKWAREKKIRSISFMNEDSKSHKICTVL